MSAGLSLPLRVNRTGGISISDRDEQASKIIGMALSSSDSENAFQQDIALEDDMIFDVQSGDLEAKILRRLVNIFRKFQLNDLFKLIPDSVKFTQDTANQELNLEFKYINLESDTEQTFTTSFGLGV